MGVKRKELKPRAVESPVKVYASCISAGNEGALLPHLHPMLKETRLLQSVSIQKTVTVHSEAYSPR